jgi:polyhydroxybutyrate depolymerase
MNFFLKPAFFIAAFLFSIGASAQLVSDSFLIDGHYRTFHFNQPAEDIANGSLFFILHGSGGNGIKSMKGAKKILSIADSENLMLVFPDGYKRNWNECRKNAPAAANMEDVDENTFFTKMIDYCVANYKIDPSKVFVAGSSGGGHMAYKLAFTMPEKFKAITAIVANIPDTGNMDCMEKRMPIPVMIINGTMDSTNPYNGGKVKNKGLVRSTDETFRYWASLAGYKGEPLMEAEPDDDTTDDKSIERYTYKKKGKPEIVLLKVINGVHGNPKIIDTYGECWKFFKRQMVLK